MKIATFPTAEKQTQMLELLKFGTVMVFVDSRHKDVVVPDYLKSDFQLRLNFDYAFEIDDFRVLPDRLEASLSFNKKNFFCVVPFEAVYLFINHGVERGSLFTESVPVEMLEVFAAMQKQEQPRSVALHSVASSPAATTTASPEASPNQQTASPNSDTVPVPAAAAKTAEANAPDSSSPSGAAEPKPKKRGHLRLVK